MIGVVGQHFVGYLRITLFRLSIVKNNIVPIDFEVMSIR